MLQPSPSPNYASRDYYIDDADWSLIPEHMRGALRRYVMRGIPMGSFGSAILSNDFIDACGRADEENRPALFGWATFIYNFTPNACHGSPEKVQAWVDQGGILGDDA